MESTGVYWIPVFEILEQRGLEVMVVNARDAKHVPGRKTDVCDAQWLQRLHEYGLLRASFRPQAEMAGLRTYLRQRERLLDYSAAHIQHMQKALTQMNLQLHHVVSDITGLTARLILNALCAGERDPQVLADLAKGRLRSKMPQLAQAVPGRFNDHHAVLVRELLKHLDFLDGSIARLDIEVEVLMIPFFGVRDRLMTIPGIKQRNAEIIIAEIGVDMTRFPTPAQLASWAGVCPGNNESAGKHRSGKTRHGDPWLCSALAEGAWSASRTRGTSMQARFWRIAKRRGHDKAVIAVAHHLLTVIWYVIGQNVTYNEMGADYLERRDDPARRQRQLVHQLEQLGYHVEITTAA
jgi:transposase